MLTPKPVNFKSRHSGFTLIEVCVVMVIIGIVVSIAVVLFSRFNERQNLLAKTERCVDILKFCQRYAMFNQTKIRMILSHHGFYLEKELAKDKFKPWLPVPEAKTNYHFLNFRWLNTASTINKNIINITFQTDGSISSPLPIPFKISIYLGDSPSFYTITIPTQGDAIIRYKGKPIESA